jgi:hypothetical protein
MMDLWPHKKRPV